ncbi:cell division protein FtsX [Pseudobdellovibrio exovorus]|uniref:Cell division protein FtsX n=1 Tax=Pseudobdellovibrio exovorus JSS TaxID=1184267 RepID=M4VMU4_9BACT|nr:permease-like cell division protein FtsX [Pseudobdellovibrio exovorus]AGH94409.1 hypothetical protein A11Q_189 [Pseudobdellovibrio exovorus JSS]
MTATTMKTTTMKATLFFVISLSLLLLISGLLFYKNLTGVLTAWQQANKMVMYLQTHVSAEQKSQLSDFLKSQPHVKSVEVIDRVAAAKTFQSSLKDFSAGLLADDELLDLVPESIEVDIDADLSLNDREAAFEAIRKAVMQEPRFSIQKNHLVEEVHFGAANMKKFARLDQILRMSGLFSFVVILLSISYLISLMLKIYIEDSKSEIEIYSLLGATRWTIYRQFLQDIFVFISISLFTAFILSLGLFIFCKDQLAKSDLSPLLVDSLRFLSFAESASLTAILFLFIFAHIYFTVQKSVDRHNQLTNE